MNERIYNDIIGATKARDMDTLSTLRLLKGAIQLEEINKKKKLDDTEIIDIVFKQIKSRKDSIVEFEKGKRQDLIDKTNNEIEILNKYLPVQLSDQELIDIIDNVILSVDAKTSSDIGKVMGMLVPRIKGKTDMSKVNLIIRDKLK